MQLRLSARTFRNSLGVNATLYRDSARITRLEEDVRRLAERVEILERQMHCTKQRETLDDAGCNSSKEKVLALQAEGMGPTTISEALDMSVNTVKSIIRRSRQ
jgi:DNA-binding NarL/FixJ family response regulator